MKSLLIQLLGFSALLALPHTQLPQPKIQQSRQFVEEPKKPEVQPPKGAEDWDEIGTYTLKGEKASVTIKLYVLDSDSVADKKEKKGTIALRTYPNYFSIHAIYQVNDGPWKHKTLYSCWRVGFLKVTEVKRERVSLQVRSKFIMMMKSDGSLPFDEETRRQIYEPETLTLVLEKDVPVLK
jgi:hypothetical protein